jgi:hypothetical protein
MSGARFIATRFLHSVSITRFKFTARAWAIFVNRAAAVVSDHASKCCATSVLNDIGSAHHARVFVHRYDEVSGNLQTLMGRF